MIWHRLSLVRTLFPGHAKAEARATARRWQKAVATQPELRADLIRMGGLLTGQPHRLIDGLPEAEPMEPSRLAYLAGRRDLALQLLALAGLSYHEMSLLMENDE